MKADSNSNNMNALVAQLDRVTGYEPVGRGFESLQARQAKNTTSFVVFFVVCGKMLCDFYRLHLFALFYFRVSTV